MCNDEVALAARDKMSVLFYVAHTTKYQQLIAYDTLYLMTLNPDDRAKVATESSRAPLSPVGEGYDFLMETRNKLYKSFLPSEITPTFE